MGHGDFKGACRYAAPLWSSSQIGAVTCEGSASKGACTRQRRMSACALRVHALTTRKRGHVQMATASVRVVVLLGYQSGCLNSGRPRRRWSTRSVYPVSPLYLVTSVPLDQSRTRHSVVG